MISVSSRGPHVAHRSDQVGRLHRSDLDHQLHFKWYAPSLHGHDDRPGCGIGWSWHRPLAVLLDNRAMFIDGNIDIPLHVAAAIHQRLRPCRYQRRLICHMVEIVTPRLQRLLPYPYTASRHQWHYQGAWAVRRLLERYGIRTVSGFPDIGLDHRHKACFDV